MHFAGVLVVDAAVLAGSPLPSNPNHHPSHNPHANPNPSPNLTLTLALTRHVHGARLRVRARLARRTLRVGHLPRPDVDGGGGQVGLVQRPRRVRHGRVPVRGGVEWTRLR